jgi:hypothetical protein
MRAAVSSTTGGRTLAKISRPPVIPCSTRVGEPCRTPFVADDIASFIVFDPLEFLVKDKKYRRH